MNGLAAPTTQAQKANVPTVLQNLGSLIADNEQLLATLCDRLNPVLGVPGPKDGALASPPQPGSANLAEMLTDACRRVQGENIILQDILSRLQL